MSSIKLFCLALCVASASCAIAQPQKPSVCPERAGSEVKSVQVFDGPVADMAILMPDEAKEDRGFWTLDYVYKAGRTVNVRCEYADKTSVDINLAEKIHKCSYSINAKKTYSLQCQ